MMSNFAESVKRLYLSEQITFTDVKHLYASGRLTLEEYRNITNAKEQE